MQTDSPRNWPQELAAYLKISPPTAQALITAGRLPSENSRNNSIADLFDDIACCTLLEQHRQQFDTSIVAFAHDLRRLAEKLLDGQEERNTHDALAGFHSFDFGQADRFYAVTTHKKPWGGHRVPLALAELEASNYSQLSALWSRGQDPFRLIAVVGELPLTGPSYRCIFNPRPEQRPFRAAFLVRLSLVLQQRSGVRS